MPSNDNTIITNSCFFIFWCFSFIRKSPNGVGDLSGLLLTLDESDLLLLSDNSKILV
jgi:hypothetical protein